MSDEIGSFFAVFHFLRPLWLLGILPAALIWWQVRPRSTEGAAGASGLAPHLARALTVGVQGVRKFYPIDGVAIMLVLLAIAAAGPTWSRYPNPLLAQTAPLVVAVKVTPSMENNDLKPTRRERAAFKILDLIERRAGAQTALFAYAGSAHRVTPLTEDPNIVRTYLEGLSPAVMPKPGDRPDLVLKAAEVELARSETPGAVMIVLDDLNPASIAAFNENAAERAPLIFFVVGPEALELTQLDQIDNASVVKITPDDKDLDQIERRVLSAYREALLGDTSQSWDDKGWLFAWPAALLMLLWFRRGWTMQWIVIFCVMATYSKPAQAEGWKDWFLTADQQGQLAFQDKEYAAAAELFEKPEWRAYAQFKSGQYELAAETYSFIETPEAAVGEGLAHIRNRQYRDGVRAFEKALERDPDYGPAQHNLEVAKTIVEYIEATRLASDTGEAGGIGADDVVFDNESGKGVTTFINPDEVEKPAPGLTTEDWMRAVDTNVGDFLSSRFRLENARGTE